MNIEKTVEFLQRELQERMMESSEGQGSGHNILAAVREGEYVSLGGPGRLKEIYRDDYPGAHFFVFSARVDQAEDLGFHDGVRRYRSTVSSCKVREVYPPRETRANPVWVSVKKTDPK